MYMFYKYKFIDFFPPHPSTEREQPTNQQKTMNKVSKFFIYIIWNETMVVGVVFYQGR